MPPTSSNSNGPGSGDDVRAELKGDAQRLKDTAQRQGEAQADRNKERVATTAKSASSAMSTAADELRNDENAPDWLASSVSSAARQVDELAGRLQDKSPRDIAHETSRFAREHPAAFLTASAAIGFAAARFLRAGSEYKDDGTGTGFDNGSASYGANAERSYDPRQGVATTTSRGATTAAPTTGAPTRTGGGVS